MEEKVLTFAGLTQVEARIYLALLESGQELAGKISRKTGIHRRSVYDALERLIEKGLVSFIKMNNKRFYQPVDPERLLDIIEEKRKALQEITPSLKAKFLSIKEKQETLFFKGKEGLKTIFEDQLREGKEIMVFAGAKDASAMIKYYFPKYTQGRIRKKIKLKIIYTEKRTKETIPLSEVRYLPQQYSSRAATNIYADKVAIIHWTEPLLAILIKNKDIADGYKNYFNLLWKIARP